MLRLLVSGFTGQEATARATSRRGEVVLRRQRARARSGYARAAGRRIVLTRGAQRIQARQREPGVGVPAMTAGRTPRNRGELNVFLASVGRAMDRVSPRTRPRTAAETTAFNALLMERGRLMDIGDRLRR